MEPACDNSQLACHHQPVRSTMKPLIKDTHSERGQTSQQRTSLKYTLYSKSPLIEDNFSIQRTKRLVPKEVALAVLDFCRVLAASILCVNIVVTAPFKLVVYGLLFGVH